MIAGEPGNGCPVGAAVCDRFVSGDWPDVVFSSVLLLCAAAVLIAWIRRPRK